MAGVAAGAASELTLDLEALKAKIADLRSSVQVPPNVLQFPLLVPSALTVSRGGGGGDGGGRASPPRWTPASTCACRWDVPCEQLRELCPHQYGSPLVALVIRRASVAAGWNRPVLLARL